MNSDGEAKKHTLLQTPSYHHNDGNALQGKFFAFSDLISDRVSLIPVHEELLERFFVILIALLLGITLRCYTADRRC